MGQSPLGTSRCVPAMSFASAIQPIVLMIMKQKTLDKNLILIASHVSRSNLRENCYDFATFPR